jgi:hypothetical protein
MLQQTWALLINFKNTESVANLNTRYIISRKPAGPGFRIFWLNPKIACIILVFNFTAGISGF